MIIIQKSQLKKGLPKETLSLCPECKRIIPATIYEENGKVMYKKTCPEHGEFIDVYFGDVESYLRMERWAVDGIGVENPNTETKYGHPFDCGLCPYHLSHTALANVDLTNRCNLKCPICFANANAAGFVYEPDLQTVIKMLKMLRDERPVPTPAVQFAGGEPTIYPHFLEAVRAARDLGFAQIQVATNGVRLAHDPNFAQAMVDAGMHTVYLQFDGFKEETYIKARGRPGFLKEKLLAIEYCRRTKPKPLATVLVPVIVRGINDDEVGKIVDFALANLDVIRSVNFQPVSFSGRINQDQRIKGRYTIGDLIRDLAEQTDYLDGPEDFFPIPAAAILSELVSQIAKEPKVAFTTHPHCGSATYLFKEQGSGRIISIARFLDADGLLDEALELVQSGELQKMGKIRGALKAYQLVKKYLDTSKAPKGVNLLSMLKSVFMKGDKSSLGEFHWRTLFIGTMHFQDLYNYDLERVRRCVIHYTTPDGRIIPFCSYNTGAEFRTEVEKKFGISIEEWQKKHPGMDLMGRDLYPEELPEEPPELKF
ncbi:MAG: radical SAM protein [Thermoplasmata archaeon]|nr:radical SAM protein [Thermoplasmata archaeon]